MRFGKGSKLRAGKFYYDRETLAQQKDARS